MLREVSRYVPIAAGYCRTGGGGEGAFMASVTTRFLHDAAGRIKEVPPDHSMISVTDPTPWNDLSISRVAPASSDHALYTIAVSCKAELLNAED